MEDKSKQVFEELFAQSENNYCFECGNKSWTTSINPDQEHPQIIGPQLIMESFSV